MTTLIEKDSPVPALVLIFVVIFLLVGCGLGFAYMNGAFGEKTTVIENNKTVENKTAILPATVAPAVPAGAPSLEKPAPAPAN